MAIDRGKSQTASLLTGTVWRTLTQPGSLVSIQTAASEVAQLALTAQEGDVVIRSDLDKAYMHNSSYGGTISDWTLLAVTTALSDIVIGGDSNWDSEAYLTWNNPTLTFNYDVLEKHLTAGSGSDNQLIERKLAKTLIDNSFDDSSDDLNLYMYTNFVLTLVDNITELSFSGATESILNWDMYGSSGVYYNQGKSGYIVFKQDGTGSRTVGLASGVKTVGGSGLTLSSAADAVDLVPYFTYAEGVLLGAPQLAFS